MRNSDELLRQLTEWQIDYELQAHAPVATMAESAALPHALRGERCKSLLLQDKRGRLYLLATSAAQGSVDLAALRTSLGSARLSFARSEVMSSRLGVTPGALSPLALINDADQAVTLVMERALAGVETFLFHPLVNTATIALSADGFAAFLERADVTPRWIELGHPAG